ncbi:hypothetical protein ACH4SP_36085 [Streptomyces sp. NPDC021093]|uniref:hypothetical protein n=1 Tax=Streptomyces sp. NPDC021093 TaxID=3365112 RepID=UPI0037BB1504
MTSSLQQAWESAALRLFDDKYSLVAAGPRTHDDWRIDALAVMGRETTDPRGWAVLDWDFEGDSRRIEVGASFPFVLPTSARLAETLYEITGASAAELLVAMTDDWFKAEDIPGFAERKGELLADAETLLSRFEPAGTYYTTARNAEATSKPDFFTEVTGGVNLTMLLMDLGLVAVSDSEIGVFWSFNDY